MERYFEYKSTTPERQYKLAKIKLVKLAAIWLEGIQKQRRREGRARIDTWDKLKKHLRRKYVPNNYAHQLYLQWSTLNQGGRSVSEYIQEWEKVIALCEINEIEDLKVAKFMAGLREDIRRKLMLVPNLDLQLAFNMAMNIDQTPAKKKVVNNQYQRNPRNFTPRNNSLSPPRMQKKVEQTPRT